MRWITLLALVFLVVGCGRGHKLPDAPGKTRNRIRKTDKAGQHRQGALLRVAVVESARKLVGSKQVYVSGKTYRSDCSGLVGGVFSAHGVELKHSPNPTPRQSAAQSMYLGASEHYRVYRKGRPRPGDIVFFENTYDANRDGRVNDAVTHVGLVEEVAEDGTVTILHFASGRVKRGRMNLAKPGTHRSPTSGAVWNDFLRRKRADDPKAVRYMTGELFVGYAAVLP